jgi:hypothetical protein
MFLLFSRSAEGNFLLVPEVLPVCLVRPNVLKLSPPELKYELYMYICFYTVGTIKLTIWKMEIFERENFKSPKKLS